MRIGAPKTAYMLLIILLALYISAFAGWSDPMRLSNPGGHASPQIIAQGDTLHIVAEDVSPTRKIAYWRSVDRGQTWSNIIVLSDTLTTYDTRNPRIIRNGPHLLTIWRYGLSHGGGFNLGCNVSTNNGLSWNQFRQVLNSNWGTPLNFTASGAGSIINVTFEGWDGDSLQFCNVRSTNFGQSWSTPIVLFKASQGGQPDQAGSGDIIHFVWDGRFSMGAPWEIRYIRSSDSGISWSSNILISSPDRFHSELPSIYSGENDIVSVSWMDYKYSPYPGTGDILCRQSPDSGLTWGPERQASFDHYAYGNDIASNGDTIHVIWVDEATSGRSIYYVRSTDAGATWSDPYWIDQTLDDSADPNLTIFNERLYVVWADSRPNPDTNLCCGLYISRYDPEPDGIKECQDNLPDEVSLSAYPNPFNTSTTLTIGNGKASDIFIYDITGRQIATLSAKEGKAVWDASAYSSGIYFAKALSGNNSSVIKLIYLK